MDNLQLNPAKLLYFITEMFKRGLIDESEKITLKEFVIADDPMMYTFLQYYERDSKEREFTDNLLSKIKPNARVHGGRAESKRGSMLKPSLFLQEAGMSSPGSINFDDASSPQSYYFLNRKVTVQKD